jgi:hypothetical protein
LAKRKTWITNGIKACSWYSFHQNASDEQSFLRLGHSWRIFWNVPSTIRESSPEVNWMHKAVHSWVSASGPLASWNWCTRAPNTTQNIFSTQCISIADLTYWYTKSLCWEFSKSWKMDELCIFHLSCCSMLTTWDIKMGARSGPETEN